MGALQDIQNMRYRFILDLIKNEEQYDKSQRVISGLEAFYLFHQRYESLQRILEPLKNILGKNITIISIGFNDTMQDEKGMAIKYLNNDKLNLMTVNMYDLEISEIILSDSLLDENNFLEQNRDIVSKIICELENIGCIDEPEILLKSSSKKITISDNCIDFIVKSSEEKLFSIGTNHFIYNKDKKIYVRDKVISDNTKLKEELMNEENIQKIYNNLRIYEEDFPKRLIKKIT